VNRNALIVSAAIGVLLVCSIHMLTAATAPEPETCMDDATRDKARALMSEGLDLALKSRTDQLFEIWMKDATDQPKRAITGMNNGVRAYAAARAAVLRWDPPSCKGDRT
jgi:hypothetical protein